MMELVINSSPKAVDIAVLRDKKLIELHQESFEQEFAVGDIYLGKIHKIVSGLNAAFVDVGYEKDAFLHYHDLGPQIRSMSKFVKDTRRGKQGGSNLMNVSREPDIDKHGTIDQVLKQGQEIMVQIDKEPISTKGPRIGAEISIPGRYLVLVPFSDRVSVSSRINDPAEKDRLKRLLRSIKPKNFGVIVRTNAEGKKVADLDKDLKDLLHKWKGAYNTLKKAKNPSKILGELSRTSALLRDILNNSFEKITVDDPEIYEEVVEFLVKKIPDAKNKVDLYKGKESIFDKTGVSKQIKTSFGRTVSSKSGVYLVIEHTEALHVIDVNSGNRTKSQNDQETNALEVNLEAAEEVARQLRLRDMGGIIVVDFIDMKNPENRKKLHQKMKEFMEDDKAKHSVLAPSKFGLVQITRQRVRPETNVKTQETCPSCNGTGVSSASLKLIDDIETQLRYVIKDLKKKKVTVAVHPYLEAYLTRGILSKRAKWQMNMGGRIKIRSAASLAMLEYHFYDGKNEEIQL